MQGPSDAANAAGSEPRAAAAALVFVRSALQPDTNIASETATAAPTFIQSRRFMYLHYRNRARSATTR